MENNDKYEELTKYYALNKGADRLERDINSLAKKGMSRDEAVNYLYDKVFKGEGHRMSRKTTLTLITLIIVIIAAVPTYYFISSANVKKAKIGNPSNTLIGMEYETWFGPTVNNWAGREATPILGLYNSTNATVIRQEADWLIWAGVNFIIIDWSNNWGANWQNGVAWYIINATSDLFTVYHEMALEGHTVPKITILLPYAPNTGATVSEVQYQANWIYKHYIENASYNSLWLYYLGKPLILMYTNGPNPSAPHFWEDPNFTVRYMAAFLEVGNPYGDWSWIDDGIPPVVVYNHGYPEAVTVTVAWSYYPFPVMGRNNGATYLEEWQTPLQAKPSFIIINQWNEFAKPDQTNVEYSNDIEPTRLGGKSANGTIGGWGYYYLVLTKALIDLYRGVTPNATIMAISNPLNGTSLSGDDLQVNWTYVGQRPNSFTILLNGKVVAEDVQGTPYLIEDSSPNHLINVKVLTYELELASLTPGHWCQLTLIANGAKSYFNLTAAYQSLVNETSQGLPCESTIYFYYERMVPTKLAPRGYVCYAMIAWRCP